MAIFSNKALTNEHFENIGKVSGSGNTSKTIAYHFTDEKPLSGISYYRIKQTDFDGSYSYSLSKTNDLTGSVNPTISLHYANEMPMVKVQSNNSDSFAMQLLNLNGAAIWSTIQVTNVGENIFPVTGVSSGLYLLQIQFSGKVQYFKVWVK